MKILIITYGSRGDVQPYVALGKGLKTAGHDVTLATSERFQSFVEGHGLTFGPLSDELLSLMESPTGKDIIENATNVFQIVRYNIKLSRRLKPLTEELMRQNWSIALNAEPDYILYHGKAFAAPHIAEKLGIGCAFATPVPMFVPTSQQPLIVLPELKLGGWYNRMGYHIVNRLHAAFIGGQVGAFRKHIGLEPMKKFDLLKTGDGHAIPVLHGHSTAVLPRPTDWPPTAHVTGYWFLNEAGVWDPPESLLRFLNDGDPPVYIGFGSMAGRDPRRLTQTVIGALQRAHLRGVIATGWGGISAEDLPPTIHKIEAAPHDWLFPRVAAVVHHGGAGTTAAGLRAGKPSVIIPFFADQPFWARRIHALGAGPKPIMKNKLTIENLAAALGEATTNPAIIAAASAIGEKIRSEDGVGAAVALVEEFAVQRATH